MKKNIITLLVLLSVFALVSCSNQSAKTSTNDGEVKKITIAVSPVPHAEIVAHAQKELEKKGYELEIREFNDYVQPNLAVQSGEVDANYFQHQPYLDDFNKEHNTDIVSIAAVHFEPFGIYAGTKKSFEELEKGDKIAVPNDTTNEARALLLLQDAGLIKLKDGVGITATVMDIVENDLDLDILEIESAQIPRVLDSVALAGMNGNYALEAGYKVSDGIFIESEKSQAAKLYANIVCVKKGRENEDFAKALAEAIKSKEVKDFITSTYDKSVVYING